ncbi:MAG: hypothetical protein IJI37_07160, partial [Opitutales bacterium]|nr:hypothetical protein [Opitutales bacterium]
TLEVKEIIRDGNLKDNPGASRKSNLHGYHGKGFYTGFGKAFYANNGVNHPSVAKDPTLKSGALAFWKPGDADWTAIRICQFTEITGKDGIRGSKDPENTPLWALGWDAKSVILMLNEADKWSSFRLPKASHSYDGSHGWNTEWPRIRDIGKKDYLMTMHGAFWKFPPAFSGADTSGIRMRSSYLKVIGDFCRFNDVVALGCDDSAKKEFFNSRPLKGKNVAPLNSNSNLWFVSDSRLDNLGPKFGRGSVFLREDVKAGIPSDAMLTGGFGNRVLVLSHQTQTPVEAEIQTSDGKGGFKISQKVLLPANSSKFIKLADAEWTRVVPKSDAKSFTAHFTLFDPDTRSAEASAIFDGVARVGEKNSSAALLRTLDINKKLMGALARARGADGIEDLGVYSLDSALNFSKNSNISKGLLAETESEPRGITYLPGAVLIEEGGKRFLLPRNGDYRGESRFGIPRVAREVVTERDIMNCGGIFYELPAINAGGMEKIRPIAAHNLDVFDFCSYCGIMFISGISDGAPALKNPRIITSADGKLSLWAGVIDDLWKLGKPVGRGEVWHEKSVSAGEVSDALLLSGFDKKTLRAVSSSDASVDVEVDIDGTGLWVKYATYKLKANSVFEKDFDGDFCGYWVRLRSSNPSEKITAAFIYR